MYLVRVLVIGQLGRPAVEIVRIVGCHLLKRTNVLLNGRSQKPIGDKKSETCFEQYKTEFQGRMV